MKSLLVFCAFLTIVFALDENTMNEMREMFMENLKNCATEVNASPDDLASLKQHTVPASHEGKCVIFCMHKVYKIQNDAGAIDIEGGRQAIDLLKDLDVDLHSKMLTIFDKCADVPNDADPCNTAANFATCSITEAKAMGLDEEFVS